MRLDSAANLDQIVALGLKQRIAWLPPNSRWGRVAKPRAREKPMEKAVKEKAPRQILVEVVLPPV